MGAKTSQMDVCKRVGAEYVPPLPGSKLGISLNVQEGMFPINGLRHPPGGDTNGWYIWDGETMSKDPGFFKPLHVEHAAAWCADIVKYLALPPGWRFLIGPGYEDVWFDADILEIPAGQ